MVARDVLAPVNPGFTRWDWENNRPGQWVSLDPAQVLIVEGVGTLTPANLRAARRRGRSVTVRVELGSAERRERALTRDPGFVDWWDHWADQEQRHAADPANVLSAVDLVVVGG